MVGAIRFEPDPLLQKQGILKNTGTLRKATTPSLSLQLRLYLSCPFLAFSPYFA
jgi:hypothetical protein